MPRRSKLLIAALALLVPVGLHVTSSAPRAEAVDQVSTAMMRGDVLALHVTGYAANESSAPGHFLFKGIALHSLATGEQVGAADEDVTCVVPSCSLVDVTTTFHLPEGDIVSKARHSTVPDIQRPGYLMTNTRPSSDTIESGTALYAGRHGVVTMSGTVNVADIPRSADFDEYFIVDFS